MTTEMNNLNCGRENDLVDFLYGELGLMEKQNFQLHMQDCADCSSQLSSFNDIRESVVSWRNESFGAFSSSVGRPTADQIERQQPSALAALREFFDLSPLWLKGTVAFASLLFCLFTVLAVTRLMETTSETVANKTDSQTPTAQELNSEVERRVKEELQRREAANKPQTIMATSDSPADDYVRRPSKRQNQLASGSPQRKAARPLSKVEREELAADLRLIVDNGDGELVLIGDRINQ